MHVLPDICLTAPELLPVKDCKFQTVIHYLSGKWKAMIIWNLKDGSLRFGELKKKLGGITEKMLTHELREFEVAEIVERKIYSQIPPKVEYKLTVKGHSLIPILYSMNAWENDQIRQHSDTAKV